LAKFFCAKMPIASRSGIVNENTAHTIILRLSFQCTAKGCQLEHFA
jgi:hypothetical protein